MQSWRGHRRLWGRSSRDVPSRMSLRAGLSTASGLGVPGHRVVLPGAPPSPHPLLPHPQDPEEHIFLTPWDREMEPSSVQEPRKPWRWPLGERRREGARGQKPAPLPGPEARARHRQGWHLGSPGSAQISVRASAGTRPRFLPLLTRMKPSASLLLPTPTQIWFSLRLR